MQIFYKDTIGDEHFRVLAEYDAEESTAKLIHIWSDGITVWVLGLPSSPPNKEYLIDRATLALLRGSCLRKCIQARQELQDSIVNTSVEAMKERI